MEVDSSAVCEVSLDADEPPPPPPVERSERLWLDERSREELLVGLERESLLPDRSPSLLVLLLVRAPSAPDSVLLLEPPPLLLLLLVGPALSLLLLVDSSLLLLLLLVGSSLSLLLLVGPPAPLLLLVEPSRLPLLVVWAPAAPLSELLLGSFELLLLRSSPLLLLLDSSSRLALLLLDSLEERVEVAPPPASVLVGLEEEGEESERELEVPSLSPSRELLDESSPRSRVLVDVSEDEVSRVRVGLPSPLRLPLVQIDPKDDIRRRGRT